MNMISVLKSLKMFFYPPDNAIQLMRGAIHIPPFFVGGGGGFILPGIEAIVVDFSNLLTLPPRL